MEQAVITVLICMGILAGLLMLGIGVGIMLRGGKKEEPKLRPYREPTFKEMEEDLKRYEDLLLVASLYQQRMVWISFLDHEGVEQVRWLTLAQLKALIEAAKKEMGAKMIKEMIEEVNSK
jgi:hypothetical protein